MESRAATRRRLFAGSGIPHQALVALLRRIRESPDIDVATSVTRAGLRASIDSLWGELGQAEAAPLSNGGHFDWHCASLPKLFQHAVATSPSLAEILRTAWARCLCTQIAPWSLICYCDEIVPGNVLRLDNNRKLLCVYVSIRELGPERLPRDALWFPLAVIRISQAKLVRGGTSVCINLVLRRLFVEDA